MTSMSRASPGLRSVCPRLLPRRERGSGPPQRAAYSRDRPAQHANGPRHCHRCHPPGAPMSIGAREPPIGRTSRAAPPGRADEPSPSPAPPGPSFRAGRAWTGPVLLVAFAAAVWLRVAVGGAAVSVSAPAGLIFAAALTALTLAAGAATRLSRRTACCGIGGAIVVCLPPALIRLAGDSHRPAGHYLPWAATVTVVAIAEEAFLRGALYDALETWSWPRSSGRRSGGRRGWRCSPPRSASPFCTSRCMDGMPPRLTRRWASGLAHCDMRRGPGPRRLSAMSWPTSPPGGFVRVACPGGLADPAAAISK